MNSEKINAAIAAFRQRHPNCVGGIVVFWQGQIQGWQIDLSTPHAWMPGVVAYAENGRVLIAKGGNDQDGAKEWAETGTDTVIPFPGRG